MAVRVAVDALGGDRAPEEIVEGALLARSGELTPVLVGPPDLDPRGLELIEAREAIAMDEKPADAVRTKPDSSLVVSVRAVAEGRAEAVVSAGNTGAFLAASFLELRRLPGVSRPAIAVMLPARHGPSVLIDAGANADARPEHLLQFAEMGTVFAREILCVAQPRVRLLSIGEEPEKGSRLTLAAYELLAQSDLDFAGNTEGRDLLSGGGDVVVCDGFTGNVTLKILEGAIRTVVEGLRSEITATPRGKLGGLLIRPAARRFAHRFDQDAYGGAYLLGIRGVVVVAHGSSSRRAVANAIRLAAKGVEQRLVERLGERLPREPVLASRRFQGDNDDQ